LVKLVTPAIVGFCICIVFVLVKMRHWQQTVAVSVNQHLESWKRAHSSLQAQLIEQRRALEQAVRSQAEAQATASALSYEKDRLKAELESLKKNERSLSQKRQALESTKTVLELHVQERSAELQRLQRQ